MNFTSTLPILLIDDEENILFTISMILRTSGFSKVLTEPDSRRVLERLAVEDVGLIILDLYMPHLSGCDLLKELTASYPQIPVIIITAANEAEMAVDCMKAGAFDYLVKPVEESQLLSCIRRADEVCSLRSEVDSLREHLLSDRLEYSEVFAPIVTRNPRMRSVFHYLEAVSPSSQPILIGGETGVGKELAARAIHELSGRTGPFVAVNIAGLDDSVFSDTLFGHRRGAFTGADLDRVGLLAQAANGTIFMDEIGDMTGASQTKLLRLIQEQEYYPLGSDKPSISTARIVAATNHDIPSLITEGAFRRDLYYRLRAHAVYIPPLRERKEDIPLLVASFLEQAAASLGRRKPTPPNDLFSYLASYDFPGNIRELRSMVFDAVARHKGRMLSMESFLEAINTSRTTLQPQRLCNYYDLNACLEALERIPTIKEAEVALIGHALKRAAGNQGVAAVHLGLSRHALNKRLIRKGGVCSNK